MTFEEMGPIQDSFVFSSPIAIGIGAIIAPRLSSIFHSFVFGKQNHGLIFSAMSASLMFVQVVLLIKCDWCLMSDNNR